MSFVPVFLDGVARYEHLPISKEAMDVTTNVGVPARKRALSVAGVIPRGVWPSPQWPTARET